MQYLLRLYYTIRPLKWRQIWYRLYYPIKKQINTKIRIDDGAIQEALNHKPIKLAALAVPKSYNPINREFRFLNISQTFPDYIDWNEQDHGLLWAYHLNYFEWLYDENVEVSARLKTIQEYTDTIYHKVGQAPYPSSLRIISWIRFFLQYPSDHAKVLGVLFEDSVRLHRFPEYHLDGNHLWENALALIHAGLFFQNTQFLSKGKALLSDCFKDQLFNDGGHKEGSPMYQSLLLWRLLQTIEIWKATNTEDVGYATLVQMAENMLGWLRNLLFIDGSWPNVNDSIPGVAPDWVDLNRYASLLNIETRNAPLQDSGYRMYRSRSVELFIDAAPISPAFQPGHQHADTGNFCLHFGGKPFIVDTGISSYTDRISRQVQRGSLAHNVMTINGMNSSDVWSRFRVGRRAGILDIKESHGQLQLTHDGFPSATITRSFHWSETKLVIEDKLSGSSKMALISSLHFAADVQVEQLDKNIFLANGIQIELGEIIRSELVNYELCTGFNEVINSKCIRMVWKSFPASMIFIFPSGATH